MSALEQRAASGCQHVGVFSPDARLYIVEPLPLGKLRFRLPFLGWGKVDYPSSANYIEESNRCEQPLQGSSTETARGNDEPHRDRYSLRLRDRPGSC